MKLIDQAKAKEIYSIRNLSFDVADVERKRFYEKYQNKFKKLPTMLSLYGYDAAKIILRMLSKDLREYVGVTGAKFKNAKVEPSHFYSINSPSSGYMSLENGTL